MSQTYLEKQKFLPPAVHTLTSEVSRWQFFQDNATEENSRLGWSNLPPCKAKNIVVKGSWNARSIQFMYMYTATSLKTNPKTYNPNQPVQNESSRWIMSAVMERRNALVFPGTIPLFEIGFTTGIQRSDGLNENFFTKHD